MTDFIELGGTVSGFGIQNGEINCLSGNDLVKLAGGAVALQRTVFEKTGAARFFAESGNTSSSPISARSILFPKRPSNGKTQ